MISSTAAAKPPPAREVNSDSPDAGVDGVAGGATPGDGAAREGERNDREAQQGAAAIPSATAVCPLAIPTATASANDIRAVDSASNSAP